MAPDILLLYGPSQMWLGSPSELAVHWRTREKNKGWWLKESKNIWINNWWYHDPWAMKVSVIIYSFLTLPVITFYNSHIAYFIRKSVDWPEDENYSSQEHVWVTSLLATYAPINVAKKSSWAPKEDKMTLTLTSIL